MLKAEEDRPSAGLLALVAVLLSCEAFEYPEDGGSIAFDQSTPSLDKRSGQRQVFIDCDLDLIDLFSKHNEPVDLFPLAKTETPLALVKLGKFILQTIRKKV